MSKKKKVGMCVICGKFGIQNEEVFKLGEGVDPETGQITESVGWAHEACVKSGEKGVDWWEGAGPDDHGDDWKDGTVYDQD